MSPSWNCIFSPDDDALLASNVPLANHDAVYTWDAHSQKVRWSAVSDVKSDPSRYCLSADGKVAAQLFYDVIKVFDISEEGSPQKSKVSRFARSFPVISRIKIRSKAPTASNTLPQVIALSPDGKMVVTASLNGQLQFWDTATGQKQSQTPPFGSGQYGSLSSGHWWLEYSPNGRYLALFDGVSPLVWDTQTLKWQTNARVAFDPSTSIAWAPDSHSLWTGSGSDSGMQWSVPELKPLRSLPVGGPVAVASDGHTIATRNITSDGTSGVWLWNIDS